jgi:hypothetical protein
MANLGPGRVYRTHLVLLIDQSAIPGAQQASPDFVLSGGGTSNPIATPGKSLPPEKIKGQDKN